MKRWITAAALFATAVCASAANRKSDKTATTATKPVPSIPKDAVKNANGTYSYTDKAGKKWLYVNTPFGVMKYDTTDTESQPAPKTSAPPKVIDKGETVRFEQPGPFGPIAWEKKKSDLTEQERQLVDAQTARPETK